MTVPPQPDGEAASSGHAHDALPASVVSWLEPVIGVLRASRRIQAKERSSLWRAASDEGAVVIKRFHTLGPWLREVHAYRAWVPNLLPFAPRLIAASEELRCLVLEERPGTEMKSLRVDERGWLTGAEALRIYRQAGALARRFRDAATGPVFGEAVAADGMPAGSCPDPVQFITAWFSGWRDQALSQLSCTPQEQAAIDWTERHLEAFRGQPAVPVNTDYDTGNWLVAPNAGLTAVIDFEFTRWGVADETFLPLWTRDYARLCPGAEQAFFEGYGSERDQAAAVRQQVLLGTVTLVALTYARRGGSAQEVAGLRSRLRQPPLD